MKLDERFNERRAQLGENDLYIWQYISTHRKECAALSIEALGAKCNVSRSTILRFAQKLGFSGFSELRLTLRMEAEEHPAPAAGFLDQTCGCYHKMIQEIREKNCAPLFRAIDSAENLYVFSSGMLQDAVAREIYRMFLVADKWFFRIQAGDEAETLLCNITERDFVLILSVSGESPHVLKLAKALKVRGVPTASITQRQQNSLAQLCRLRLYISTVEIDFGTDYQSAASFFILSELLFLKYMAYRKEVEENASGGSDRAKLPPAERK